VPGAVGGEVYQACADSRSRKYRSAQSTGFAPEQVLEQSASSFKDHSGHPGTPPLVVLLREEIIIAETHNHPANTAEPGHPSPRIRQFPKDVQGVPAPAAPPGVGSGLSLMRLTRMANIGTAMLAYHA
jgi:hypothetical protein